MARYRTSRNIAELLGIPLDDPDIELEPEEGQDGPSEREE
jgi:hypothetical protein